MNHFENDWVKMGLLVAFLLLIGAVYSVQSENMERDAPFLGGAAWIHFENNTTHVLTWNNQTAFNVRMGVDNLSKFYEVESGVLPLISADENFTCYSFQTTAQRIEFETEYDEYGPENKTVIHNDTVISYTTDGKQGKITISHNQTDRWNIKLMNAEMDGNPYLFQGTINKTFVNGTFDHGCFYATPLV